MNAMGYHVCPGCEGVYIGEQYRGVCPSCRFLERKAELFDMLLADLAEMGLAESLRTKYQALAKDG